MSIPMLDEQMSFFGGAAKYCIEIRVFHELKNTLEVFRLRLIESNSTHYKHNEFIPIGLNLVKKNTIIIADGHPILLIKFIKDILKDESALAGRKPLVLFLVWADFGGNLGDHLQGEGHGLVIVA